MHSLKQGTLSVRSSINLLPVFTLIALSHTTSASQQVWVVDNNPGLGVHFNSIQDAIDAAEDGDTIEINPGVYTNPNAPEVIHTRGKALEIRGEPGQTFIDGNFARRGIRCELGATSSFSGLTVMNCLADFGSGMLIAASAPIVENCVFQSNFATVDGGAVLAFNGPTLTPSFVDCTFQFNEAASDVGRGGAAFIIENASFARCTFLKNAATDGGAVYFTEGDAQEIHSCIFAENEAFSDGGAIYIDGGEFFSSKCSFRQNNTVPAGGWGFEVAPGTFEDLPNAGRGGALFIAPGSNVQVVDANFSTNGSENGGAAASKGTSALHFERCEFVDNWAADDGGAMNLDTGAVLTLTECLFDLNIARDSAGAIYGVKNEITIVDSTLSHNEAWDEFGAIQLESLRSLSISGSTFIHNKGAAYSAGCWFQTDLNVWQGGSVENTSFTANQGGEALSANLSQSDQAFALRDCSFFVNFDGGASIRGGTTAIESCDFVGNLETGLDYVAADGLIRDCNFRSNRARLGGGLSIENRLTHNEPLLGSYQVLDCVFADNTASRNGGGAVFVLNTDALFERCLFENNHATNDVLGDGGAVHCVNWSPADEIAPTFRQCAFYDNTAQRNGGAIVNISMTNLLIDECVMERNLAQRKGGAVANIHMFGLDDPSHVEIRNSTIRNNTAPIGGGIWVNTFADNDGNNFEVTTEISNSLICSNLIDQINGPVIDNGGNIIADQCPPDCVADFDNDGEVNGADLAALLGAWGDFDGSEDINGDGIVDGQDLALLMGAWGPCQ